MMESTKVSSPQGTPSSHSVRSRATSQAPEANDSGAGGFLALLAALGDMADGQVGGASLEQAGEGGDPTLLGATDAADRPLDPSEVAAWQSLLVPAGPTVSAGVPQPGTTSGVGAQGALGVQMGGELPTAMLNGANGLPGGIVAETAMLDTSADLKLGPPQGGGMAYGRNTPRLQNALAQKADAVEMSSFSSRSQSSVASLQSASPQTAWAAAFQALGERAAAGSTAMGGPSRLAGGTPGVDAGGGLSLSEPLLSPGGDARPSGGAFGGSSAGEGRFAPVAASDSGNAAAPVEPGALDGAAPFAESVHAGVEEQIAEQVAYWVNQKTQNAEISINRDGQPVEVLVSLSGNEAHVTFRSDQLQTRELLDRSMEQLRELLQQEGLVLSGTSVSTSGGRDPGAKDADRQAQRDGARRAQAVVSAPSGPSSVQRGSASDRGIDVFV